MPCDESFGTKRARRPSLLALFGLDGNQNRGNADHLEGALHRDHGAMAQPSTPGQKHGIGSNPVHLAGQGGDGVLANLAQRLAKTH